MGARAAPSRPCSRRGAKESPMSAARPVFFPLLDLLSFPGDKKRIYATAPACTEPGPSRLGQNSAARTRFSKQNVEFLVASREERFHPNLFGRAVCSRVPYECVGLSAMGRKLSLRNLQRTDIFSRKCVAGDESPDAAVPRYLDFHLVVRCRGF